MKIARLFGGAAALCAFVAVTLLYARLPARSFDLQGSPTVVARPPADITDTYFFPSPTNSQNVVVVMDVDPLISPTLASTTFFDQTVLYTMKFDNQFGNSGISIGSKPTEDLVIQFAFSAPTGPIGQQTQLVSLYGPSTPTSVGTAAKLVNGGAASGSGFINKAFASLSTPGLSVFAGLRRDPAFLSGAATNRQPQGLPGSYLGIFPGQNPSTQTGLTCLPGGSNTCPQGLTVTTDLFGGQDVLAIVVEMPKALLAGTGNGVVAYWATTSTSSGH